MVWDRSPFETRQSSHWVYFTFLNVGDQSSSKQERSVYQWLYASNCILWIMQINEYCYYYFAHASEAAQRYKILGMLINHNWTEGGRTSTAVVWSRQTNVLKSVESFWTEDWSKMVSLPVWYETLSNFKSNLRAGEPSRAVLKCCWVNYITWGLVSSQAHCTYKWIDYAVSPSLIPESSKGSWQEAPQEAWPESHLQHLCHVWPGPDSRVQGGQPPNSRTHRHSSAVWSPVNLVYRP